MACFICFSVPYRNNLLQRQTWSHGRTQPKQNNLLRLNFCAISQFLLIWKILLKHLVCGRHLPGTGIQAWKCITVSNCTPITIFKSIFLTAYRGASKIFFPQTLLIFNLKNIKKHSREAQWLFTIYSVR